MQVINSIYQIFFFHSTDSFFTPAPLVTITVFSLRLYASSSSFAQKINWCAWKKNVLFFQKCNDLASEIVLCVVKLGATKSRNLWCSQREQYIYYMHRTTTKKTHKHIIHNIRPHKIQSEYENSCSNCTACRKFGMYFKIMTPICNFACERVANWWRSTDRACLLFCSSSAARYLRKQPSFFLVCCIESYCESMSILSVHLISHTGT